MSFVQCIILQPSWTGLHVLEILRRRSDTKAGSVVFIVDSDTPRVTGKSSVTPHRYNRNETVTTRSGWFTLHIPRRFNKDTVGMPGKSFNDANRSIVASSLTTASMRLATVAGAHRNACTTCSAVPLPFNSACTTSTMRCSKSGMYVLIASYCGCCLMSVTHSSAAELARPKTSMLVYQ